MANNTEQIAKAVTEMAKALGEAADAAMAGGGRGGTAVASLSGRSTAELKAMLPGSIVKLNTGAWAFVPVNSGVVLGGDGSSALVCLKSDDGRGERKTIAWMADNVTALMPGVLTVGGKPGPRGRHLLNGVEATLEIVPAKPIEHGKIVIGGGEMAAEPLEACIDKLGLRSAWRPWGEGEQPSELLRDGGLKPIDQARGVMVRTVEIHGGGPLGAMTGAKLLTVCPTLPVALKAADAAALLCEFAGMDRDLLDATTLGQSADATAVAAGGTAETKALVAARDKLRRDFGTALGHVPNETILRAQAILTNLDSQGLFKAWAQVGAALRAAIVHDARVAAAPSPSPAPAPAPEAPDTPRTALIKEMRAEMAKLKRALDFREASGGAPAPAPAPGAGATAAAPTGAFGLKGWAALRPAV